MTVMLCGWYNHATLVELRSIRYRSSAETFFRSKIAVSMFLAVTGAAYRGSWKEQQPSSFSTTRRLKCDSQDHTLADEFSVGLCMF